MITDSNLTELFDRYLENDLNFFERQEFELRLKNDREFAEGFRLHKEVDKALIEEDVLNFRLQLESIGLEHSSLLQAAPMVIADDFNLIGSAILEQDVMALRDQLNRIHSSMLEEVDPAEIPGYMGIERAIMNQDPNLLNRELAEYERMAASVEDEQLASLSREVDKAILEEDVMSLRNTLDGIGKRAVVPERKVVPLRKKVIAYTSTAVAAVFICIIAGSIFLNTTSKSFTSEQSIAKYFQPYAFLGIPRGPSEESNKIFQLALQQYNNRNFEVALQLFEASGNNEETTKIYAGTSALYSGDIDKALTYFANWDEDSPSILEVQWYTAACYLKKGEIDKAKALLKKISENPDSQDLNKQAATLLKKLEKAR